MNALLAIVLLGGIWDMCEVKQASPWEMCEVVAQKPVEEVAPKPIVRQQVIQPSRKLQTTTRQGLFRKLRR